MKLSENIKMGKLSALIATFVVCALSGASAVETDTYYTITVDEGTRTSPALLDNLNVTVSRPGEELVEMPFADASAAFASGPAIFRKRGTGWMMSSTKMATFTGEIRIEEGAFMVNTNLMTGPQAIATAPTVVVSNGASFALASTSATCAANTLKLYNHFHFQGNGVDNLGAIANCLGNGQYYCFNNDWTLDDDMLICGTSAYRFDIVDKRTVYMNGHTLTLKKGSAGYWTFCPGSSRFIDGHIIVDGMSIGPQSYWLTGGWQTDANSTLTLTNGSTLVYYNSALAIPWTLIMEGGTLFAIGGKDDGSFSDYGYTSEYGRWDGPLVANGSVKIAGNAAHKGLVLKGPLSGTGPINAGSGWLQLLADSPDYLGELNILQKVGSYSVRESGLGLYRPNALNPAGAGVSFSNAVLRLATAEAYKLPPITAYVSAGTNYTFAGGNGSSMYSSLLKTGEGRLDIDSPVTVTGKLELAGGTLRLAPMTQTPCYSLMGGLWKDVVLEGNDAAGYMGTQAFSSNDVVSCCDQMKLPTYPPWVERAAVAWGGYIWNRSATNETWRFAVGVTGYSKFYIDGTRLIGTDDNQQVFFYNKSMTPGPHKFLFKVNPRNYGHPGSVVAKPTKNKNWTNDKLGIAVSLTSTTSTNSADFVFMENGGATFTHPGGDGYLFTRDNRDVGDFNAEELEALSMGRHLISNVVCHAGTVLDLGEGNEVPLYVPRFEGVTTVTNGGLTVVESWKLKPEDVVGGGLKVYGELKFKADAALLWEDLNLLPRKPEKVLAMATGGIDGVPTWTPADLASSRWRLAKAKDADGNDILTFTWCAGTTFILR